MIPLLSSGGLSVVAELENLQFTFTPAPKDLADTVLIATGNTGKSLLFDHK